MDNGGNESILDTYLYETNTLLEQLDSIVLAAEQADTFTQNDVNEIFRIMEVREAVDGDELRRGLALVAPADLQCRVVRIGNRYRVACKPGDKVSGHRPSVDVLFQSM